MSKYLKFWGTRGSCPVSGPKYAKFGGNTSCLEVCYEEAHLIIDAGTGIRPLGEELIHKKKPIHLLLSHSHWDHVIGFPFFEPLYSSDSEIHIWTPIENGKKGREIFEDLLKVEFFPVALNELKAKLHFHSIETNAPLHFGPLKIEVHRTHHPSTALCFKIKTPNQVIGYGTDNEMFQNFHGDLEDAPKDLSLVSFFRGCDLLIHEAQYFPEEYKKKVGWGHSSAINAAALLYQANIQKWLVVHHDPQHTDDDLLELSTFSQKLLSDHGIPCAAEWIGDGHILNLK